MAIQHHRMQPYFDPSTRVSILAPATWSAIPLDDGELQIVGDVEPAHGDHRPIMNYLHLGTADGTIDWLEETATVSLQGMEATYLGFKLLHEERFMLSCGAATYLRRYEQRDETTGTMFSQMLGIVAGPEGAQYLVNATTRTVLAPKIAPIFEAILRSTRIIS